MSATHPCASGDVPEPASKFLLFGPQLTQPSQAYLLELRASIVDNPDLKPLCDAIAGLPSIWPTIQQACPCLTKIRGAEQFSQLSHFLESGTLPNVKALNSILLIPLTVIGHIVEFLRLSQGAEIANNPNFLPAEHGLANVQGFCVGFLAAAAVVSSRNKTDFYQFASIALRLAVCIGSVIDYDEGELLDPFDGSCSFAVRWVTELEQVHLKRTLDDYPSVSCHFFKGFTSKLILFHLQEMAGRRASKV